MSCERKGYLLRPDYFEKVNGMLDDDDQASTTHRAKTRTFVPRLNDGSQLQANKG
jgi:hypothetical protein